MPTVENAIPTTSTQSRVVTLSDHVWKEREARHKQRVAAQAEAFVKRRAHGETHPVWDFLFTYYSFSPNKLTTWVPGILTADEIDDMETRHWEAPPLTDRFRKEAAWIAQLCANIVSKPARLACYGLHEWAMVYRQSAEKVRHSGYTLRLSPEELATFIESQSLCCTHFDAFRFFTAEARPLNALNPSFESRLEMEQPGCLHANMDLYKWAYKLWPWIGSDLLADAFEVALFGRDLDMRASPYDLAALGFEPIAIETAEGRVQYVAAQRELAIRSEPVRKALQEAATTLAGL
ncbi:MAG: hypothetical protein RL693_2484 [Verrucomicrobiota bacterium]